MSNELMRPIDPETARAIEEAAKLGGKLVDAGTKAGGYLDRVLGRLPDNIVGLVLGDWLLHKRIRRWAELQAETEEILRKNGVKEPFADVSPSIALLLIEAAVDETRDGVKQFWARLLAAAMDPSTGPRVRQSFITVLSQLDPLDARILDWSAKQERKEISDPEAVIVTEVGTSRDEVAISLENLHRLGCTLSNTQPALSAFGRELMRLCRE
jgi:hypothetical protein